MSNQEEHKQALKKALDILSRRDHAITELELKLRSRGIENTVIEGVLDYLVDKNYLNDRRFAESFVRMRVGKGYGERDISARLSGKGLSRTDIQGALASCEVDWKECAFQALEKKFRHLDFSSESSSVHAADAHSDSQHDLRLKGARFLQSRGFNAEQTYAALDRLRANVSEASYSDL